MRLFAAAIGFVIAVLLAPHVQWRAAAHELPGAMEARGLSPSGPLAQFGLIVAMTFIAAFVARGRPRPQPPGAPARRPRFAKGRWYGVALGALLVFLYPLFLLRHPPALDFFEDGHELVVASELARGERPFADIVPVHGLLADGGIDWLVIEAGGDLHDILETKLVVSCFNLVAIFAVAFAATGSAGLALLAATLSVLLIPSATIWIRTIPALYALACTAAAVRLRSARWLAATGALLVVAALWGFDFAVYSAIVALAVALRMRRLGALLLGVAIAAVPLLLVFAILGFAKAFLTTTLFELLPAGRVYVPGPLTWPAEAAPVALWIAALLFAAATTRLRIRRSDAVWPVALWVVVAGISYAQRRHLYANFAVTAFLAGVIWLVARRQRVAAIAMTVAVILLAKPWDHVTKIALPLIHSGGIPGPLVPPDIQKGIDAARRFADANLKPGETFFDFSDSPALYYFLGRHCPTRHHQVPFLESEEEQREVVAALERNPSVRAAVITCPGGNWMIDDVPNRVRAPLVWQYLQTRFRPSFNEDGVEIWVKTSALPRPPSSGA